MDILGIQVLGTLSLGELILAAGIIWAWYKGSGSPLKPAPKPKAAPKPVDPAGKVYVLSNPSFRPGIFKIGLTKRDVSKRMSELFTTGVPTPYNECIVFESDDCKKLEEEFHAYFAPSRVNNRREFFELRLSDFYTLMSTTGSTIISFNARSIAHALDHPSGHPVERVLETFREQATS